VRLEADFVTTSAYYEIDAGNLFVPDRADYTQIIPLDLYFVTTSADASNLFIPDRGLVHEIRRGQSKLPHCCQAACPVHRAARPLSRFPAVAQFPACAHERTVQWHGEAG